MIIIKVSMLCGVGLEWHPCLYPGMPMILIVFILFDDISVSTMCIYCDYCVYHYKSTKLVSLYTLDIGL